MTKISSRVGSYLHVSRDMIVRLPLPLGRRRLLASFVRSASRQVDLRDKMIASLLSLDGCEHLLRASPLPHILWNFGAILSSSSGSAATYRLSCEVQVISHFISHNWAVGRFPKFIALIYEFNFDRAAAITAVVSCFLGLAAGFQVVPVDPHALKNPWPSTYIGRLCVGPTFFLSLLFSQTYSLRSPMVFLDKVCIAQGNKDIMQASILKLGAFIAKSERMVILYTDIYTQKLWTVYELACFLSLHGAGRLVIVHVEQAALYLQIIALGWLWVNLASLGERIFPAAALLVSYILGPILALGAVLVFRRLAREKAALISRLCGFEVRACVCAVEADRPVVYHNISTFMQATYDLPAVATSEEALDAFNKMVRAELPAAVLASLGRMSFGYKHIVMFGMTVSGSFLLDVSPTGHHFGSWCR